GIPRLEIRAKTMRFRHRRFRSQNEVARDIDRSRHWAILWIQRANRQRKFSMIFQKTSVRANRSNAASQLHPPEFSNPYRFDLAQLPSAAKSRPDDTRRDR